MPLRTNCTGKTVNNAFGSSTDGVCISTRKCLVSKTRKNLGVEVLPNLERSITISYNRCQQLPKESEKGTFVWGTSSTVNAYTGKEIDGSNISAYVQIFPGSVKVLESIRISAIHEPIYLPHYDPVSKSISGSITDPYEGVTPTAFVIMLAIRNFA